MRSVVIVAVILTGTVIMSVGLAVAGPLDSPGAVKALTCSACHGPGGQSPSDTMPILAGLMPAYFKKAIDDYAAGRRPSPEMEPYAKMVKELGVDDVAGYFAAQPRQATRVSLDSAAVARGRAAAPQCAICHGPDGRGDAAKVIPDLRGQPPGYLKNQMMLFKQDRRSPADEQLKAVKALMKMIPDETFADLAAYFASQR
jgi:cytochrome c553